MSRTTGIGPLGYGVRPRRAPSAPGTGRSVTRILTDINNVPLANLTGLRWAWFDQPLPDNLLVATDEGNGGATNDLGEFTFVLNNSVLVDGQTGRIDVSDFVNTYVGGGPVTLP